VAALLLITGVLTYRGIDARRAADKDDPDTTLARQLLRPLAPRPADPQMAEPEWEALWELAANRRGRLGYRFVEEASRTPGTSRQLRDRAAPALHAAVGLDEERRAEVEALLLARLDDLALGDEQKGDLALAASAWDGLSSPAAGRTARQLAQASKDANDPTASYELARSLSALAPRLESKDAASVATTLVQVMKQDTKGLFALQGLVGCLSALAERLDAKDAGQVATALAQVVKDTKGPSDLQLLAQGLSAVVARMEPKEAATVATQAAATLTQAIKDTKNPSLFGPRELV
jgi:hypothetical protein